MKKMFIALGIAFALIAIAVVPSINAQIEDRNAKDARIEAIENEFINQFEARYNADPDIKVVDIEWHGGVEDGARDGYYTVIFDNDDMLGSWRIDASDLTIA